MSEDAKAALRKAAREARKGAHDPVRGAGAAAALLEVLRDHSGAVISGYMPIGSEVSPLPAMIGMMPHASITVPVIQGKGLPLIFRQWRPDSAMIEGPFGALVPSEGAFMAPTVLIVPLLAFDRAGNRLGYGGGYYDRTLQALRAQGPARAIGFAYGAQEVEAVPTEPTDQRLDLIVTDKGRITPTA